MSLAVNPFTKFFVIGEFRYTWILYHNANPLASPQVYYVSSSFLPITDEYDDDDISSSSVLLSYLYHSKYI